MDRGDGTGVEVEGGALSFRSASKRVDATEPTRRTPQLQTRPESEPDD